MPAGFLLVDKPEGWTSHDVVGYLRKVTRIKKIGHAGTLDPFATGLLIVAIERAATKKIDDFKKMPKTYLANLHLGAQTDTYDRTGKIIATTSLPPPTLAEIEAVLQKFIGRQLQTPPMFSAKKIQGQKLYTLARQGIQIERPSCEIEIFKIKLIKYNYPELIIEVECGSGTYIRSLANDIGQAVGNMAYCQDLRREKIGPSLVKNAYQPKDIHTPIDKLLLSSL
jgi:tRNA pseudouridine55 synthase